MTTKYKLLPEQPTDQMVLEMAQGFIASMNVANEENHDLTNPDVARIVFGFIYELAWQVAPNAPDIEQNPVAWVLECSGDDQPDRILYDDERHCLLDAEEPNCICKPLYTHSQPKSEPLSKEAIMQLLKQRDEEMHIVDFIRYVERAHGIGVEK